MCFRFPYAILHRIIAKRRRSSVNRPRIIAKGVARLQIDLASLQNRFITMQNGLASLQDRFAALFHALALMREAIAASSRRLGDLDRGVVALCRVTGTIGVGHCIAAEVFEVFLHPLGEVDGLGTVGIQ